MADLWCGVLMVDARWHDGMITGLRNKREIWRVNFTLAKVRQIARVLLTLEEKVCPTQRNATHPATPDPRLN